LGFEFLKLLELELLKLKEEKSEEQQSESKKSNNGEEKVTKVGKGIKKVTAKSNASKEATS
jgi:hypothetical protein